jgi:hypothetical protein
MGRDPKYVVTGTGVAGFGGFQPVSRRALRCRLRVAEANQNGQQAEAWGCSVATS